MRKIVLTFLLFISVTISVFAQYKPFQFGLNISPSINATKLNCDNLSEGMTKISFNWGFTGNFYFVENYGFQTGFNFKHIRGGYTFGDSLDMPIQRNISNQYLEIPLGLMMRTEKIGKFRILGSVGYGLGVLLKSKQTDFDAENNEIELPNEARKIRNAFILKLGFDYNIYKSSCLSFALVYDNNFTNIFKNNSSEDTATSGHKVSLNNFALEIGFMF